MERHRQKGEGGPPVEKGLRSGELLRVVGRE